MKDYDTVLTEAETEFTEKRSRFICAIKPVTTAEEAMEFIAQRRERFYDARHTVYAYLLKDGVCRHRKICINICLMLINHLLYGSMRIQKVLI